MHTLLVIIMLIITRLSMIARLNVALKRTAFVDSD